MNKEIDFLALVIDVVNYATKNFNESRNTIITKNEVAENYAYKWAKIFKEKFERETAVQFSARYYEHLQTFVEARVKEVIKEESQKVGKVAKLVTFELTTRVVVNKNEMPECEEEDAIGAALNKIRENNNVDMWLCFDNCTEVTDDTECPYGTFDEEKMKKYDVTIFNRFNTDERENIEVFAMSQDEAEQNAIGGLLDGWGVLESKEIS